MSQVRNVAVPVLMILMLIVAMGCSQGNESSLISPETGQHSDGWYTAHRTAYTSNPSVCQECHGADLSGGISQVSCFSSSFEGLSCHANGPSGHPAGWSSSSSHGPVAKSAPGASSGFESCQVCHGNDFTGGSVNQSCFICHGVSAPHPSSPWRGGSLTHTNTDPGNAVVCALCHQAPSLPQGTTPGCFNNTLCHGNAAHPSGWNSGSVHGIEAEQDFSACTVCHGDTYQGGSGSSISCYDCHNGPGLNHPAPQWVISNHATAATNNIASCQTCHGTNYQGGGSHVACTSCHMENEAQVHPQNWYPDIRLNHGAYASANGTASCATQYCHGTSLEGVAQSGPSCSTCHEWPFTGGGSCTNCHGTPPDGSTDPNVAGRHAEHMALAGVDCAVCHQNAGSGTSLHQNGVVDISLSSTYNAQSGTASFNASAVTCSTVSCHGGQTSPYWVSGSINVDSQCTSCHSSGTAQYNSYNSGRHSRHSSYPCYECHDTGRLQPVHFNDLNTTQMTEASQTIRLDANYSGGRCSLTCHGKTHNNVSW